MKQKTEEPLLKNIQQALEKHLTKLESLVPHEEALTVRWNPRSKSEVSGEVVDNTIYVYDENLQEAIATLKHEYLDYLLTRKMIEPLIAIVNTLIKLREREIYKEKEQIVSILSKLI